MRHASPVPGANDAAELVDFSGDLDQLLRAIGRMLRRSGKNRKRLDELATAYCGEGKVFDATVLLLRLAAREFRTPNAERANQPSSRASPHRRTCPVTPLCAGRSSSSVVGARRRSSSLAHARAASHV